MFLKMHAGVKTMKQFLTIALAAAFVFSMIDCGQKSLVDEKAQAVHIIPEPVQLQPGSGSFEITKDVTVVVATDDKDAAETAGYLADALSKAAGFDVAVVDAQKAGEKAISLKIDAESDLGAEGYALDVTPSNVSLTAGTAAGLCWGVQTIFQLLPEDIYATSGKVSLSISAVAIKDFPRYGYRGMHLDVGRHFFSAEFVKRYIDFIAMHKMNVLHWHLTEDQGWRIEIKKYPKLIEISAFRDETLIGHGGGPEFKYDGKRYGRFYTQDQVRDIVAHAKKRHVTIIPEIELPGHSLAVLAAYPEFGCTDGPFKVGTRWGVFDDVYCAGNEQVFEFLEDVLSEVVDLFPGTYIHIGGDECPKKRWEECEKCQARIKAEGLHDEHELQSYFIRRIEKFLLSKGRRLIGWDEILEGGLAPEATVMSWRGTAGGIDAAKQGHDVIMTPNSHCYFDHYQADPETEPLAIGGYLPLKKVYNYEPTPPELTETEAKHILGAQANLWSEYIPTPEHMEYMVFPRMCALAEVVWSPKESRNWIDFNARLQTHLLRLDKLNVNYADPSYRVGISTSVDKKEATALVLMRSDHIDPVIRYTLDGSALTASSPQYSGPITLKKTATIRAAIFKGDELKGHPAERVVSLHKGMGKEVTLAEQFSPKYAAGGPAGLVDGLSGSKGHGDGNWQGYNGNDLNATVDLGDVTEINSISARFLQNTGSWIFMPKAVEFFVSENGVDFKSIKKVNSTVSPDKDGAIIQTFQADASLKTRYVKVIGTNLGVCPEGHPGAGGNAWLFVDEIAID
jgi:hexosaminidase